MDKNRNIVAAMFRSHEQGERAVSELLEAGYPEEAISVISMDEGKATARDGEGHVRDDHQDNKGSGALKGLGIGGGVGAVAGLAALAIPGVGPFIAAGALAETLGAVGSAAVVSGAVGATAGGLPGALVDYGIDREHAEHYARKIKEGGTFVAVDTSHSAADHAAVRAILRAAGGESAETDERVEDHA